MRYYTQPPLKANFEIKKLNLKVKVLNHSLESSDETFESKM